MIAQTGTTETAKMTRVISTLLTLRSIMGIIKRVQGDLDLAMVMTVSTRLIAIRTNTIKLTTSRRME